MGVHRLPKDVGSWTDVPLQHRVCQLCASGSLCDEKHVVFEYSALQVLLEQYAPLFVEAYTMKQFFWQGDLLSVTKFVNACLDKMFLCATVSSNDSQTSDQPDVAGET